ncbi:MAG: LytR cell envelope-related transcriptional attenuator, partial [Actinomycetota bacterium]
PKPSVDPLRINETKVVDGVGQVGLAGTVARKLIDKGWNVVTAANIDTGVPATNTVIYINSAQLNDAAKALTGDLGNYAIEVSNQYIDPITVVLGADYK